MEMVHVLRASAALALSAASLLLGASGSGTATFFAPGAQISSTSVAAASFRLLTTTSC